MSNKVKDSLKQALKEMQLIRAGKLPKRSARQMLEELRKESDKFNYDREMMSESMEFRRKARDRD